MYARKLLASAQLRASHPADAAATLAPALKSTSEDAQLLALVGRIVHAGARLQQGRGIL
ncbi:hypothetical protein LP419_18370 [Massilia sp. H-1]|nr:hypothetical protein LP419_18370 [Massilia sp. H-1]